MTRRRLAIIAASLVLVAAVVSLLLVAFPRRGARPGAGSETAVSSPAAPLSQGRKIKAQLFYVSEDGGRLISAERDVAYAEQPIDQAREILNAQLAPVAAPLVSAIPPGTVLRALFLTENGQAFVDLSRDAATAHPGGSLNEMLTIYTIVHALTFNLPAITAVQLLVDGKEVDTLAGHIDLRRPLSKNLQLTTEN
jgi:spore germination protein GerM